MNQLIKQLAESAFQPINDMASEGIADRHTFEQAWFQHYNQQFAELIVRECMDQVAEFNRLTKAHQEQGIDPEIDVAKEVLKNFGFTRFPRS